MNNFKDGDIVIVSTHQSGCIIQISNKDAWVLLKNGDVWIGPIHSIREPQGQNDLLACPLNVDREENKRTIRSEN